MVAVVGYIPTPEGRAAIERAVVEARDRGLTLLIVNATRLTEFRARGQVQVALREIEGLGHAWSGGAPRVPYSDPTGPDATALVWAFMERQFASTP